VNPESTLARGLALSIDNVGRVNFAVIEIEITISDEIPESTRHNETIPMGIGMRNIVLPDFWRKVRTGISFAFDVQIKVRVRWMDREEWLPPCGFNVGLAVNDESPRITKPGYAELRRYPCPRCRRASFDYLMNVEGVQDEEQLQRRNEDAP